MAKAQKSRLSSKAKSQGTRPYTSPEYFEDAFVHRVGQHPMEWVRMKLDGGSDVGSVRCLYDINARAIAQDDNCIPVPFDDYYSQYQKAKENTAVPQYSKKIYNKLVRDRIPEIIESSGRTCTCSTLTAEDYISMLDAKLDEELSEYQENKSLEELADLVEVIGAVVKARGYTWEQLTSVRKKKLSECGGFEKRILLVEVSEEKDVSDPTAASKSHQPKQEQAAPSAEKKHLPANAGKPWLPEDDKKLSNMFDNGCPQEDMCTYFKRTKGAITARLVLLGKIQKNPN